MTTNVLDLRGALLATDSRWSVETDDFVLYIDNTNFDKIFSSEKHSLVFVFAGCAELIDEWKEWLKKPINSTPSTEKITNDGLKLSIALSIVDVAKRSLVFSEGIDINHQNIVYFAGSGSRFAHNCWFSNNCAIKAIETAKTKDIFSGGDVKFFNLDDLSNNLVNSKSLNDVKLQLAQEGFVMYANNAHTVVDITTAAANDDKVKNIQADLISGGKNISVTAPCDGMLNTWSDESKAKLEKILAESFELNL